jgi:CDP-6-deoxy-D-xylo-4-hexulose-3-dehydrase
MLKNLKNQTLISSLRNSIFEKVNKIIIPGDDYIPVTGKVLDEDDILMGVDSMLDAWLTAGRYSEEFERSLAKYMGSRFSFLVN